MRSVVLAALIGVMALLMGAAIGASAQAEARVVSQGPATQFHAQRYVLHSEKVGRDFLIEVTAPLAQPMAGLKFPAIYALDIGYGVAGPSGLLLGASGAMTPAFIVAVGYTNADLGGARWRDVDLLHEKIRPPNGEAIGGGGAAFEAFLREELRPFIERVYPADPERAVLVGHSFGGLFAAHVLDRDPHAFFGYVIVGAGYDEDKTLPGRVRAQAGRGEGRRVYISTAEGEAPAMTALSDALAAALTGPGSTFQVRRDVFPGESHMSHYLRIAPAAFPFILPPPPQTHTAMAPDTRRLDDYVGVYRIDDQRAVAVTRQGDRLYGQLTGQPPLELLQEGAGAFFVQGMTAQARFLPAVGRATAVRLNLNGAEGTARRID